MEGSHGERRGSFIKTQTSRGLDFTFLYGYLLLICTFIFFVGTMYTLTVSKFMPNTGNAILDAIKADDYYCLLIPVTILVTWLFIYFNWMSLKFFRHN